MSDSKDPKMTTTTGSEKTEKTEKTEKKTGFMSRMAHGVGAFIQGAVVASDNTLKFAQDTKDKSAHGALSGSRKRRKQEKKKRDNKPLFDKQASNFSEEQKKELSLILEKHFDEMEEDEYEEVTDEQEEDDGYFGITDPGLTAPTMTMGIRNSFGDFFGNTADAMESRVNLDRAERKKSIYR